MARLVRPYIRIATRVQVAERQSRECNLLARRREESLRSYLNHMIFVLFGDRKVELHHRPALVNRTWNKRKKDYDPPANSPEHLVYLRKDDHDIETRVRGVGAQRSDLSQARYNKRVTKNRARKTAKAAAKYNRKYNWPSRPLRSRPKRPPNRKDNL